MGLIDTWEDMQIFSIMWYEEARAESVQLSVIISGHHILLQFLDCMVERKHRGGILMPS